MLVCVRESEQELQCASVSGLDKQVQMCERLCESLFVLVREIERVTNVAVSSGHNGLQKS